jgi:biotin carboxylase
VYQRAAVLELAREEGIRVPDSLVIADMGDLDKWIERTGLPFVLKSNGTSGGEGVRIVHTLEDAQRAFRVLQAPPPFVRAIKRALADQDLTLIPPLLLRRRRVVSAQRFIAGRDATSLIACCKGVVLAALHFEVINKQDSTGPASVLRAIDNPEMSAAAEKIVGRLNLSGLHGLDFLLEAETGNPFLIELNPRTTQVGHLRLGPGRDLPAALYAAVTGKAIREAPKITDNKTITLFPQEWTRNPESPFLLSGYHDIPWQEPELVRACLRRPRKWGAWNSQRKWAEPFSTVHRLRL